MNKDDAVTDEALLEELDRLARDPLGETESTLDHELREIVAMLPYALDDEAPRPAAKAELMAKLSPLSASLPEAASPSEAVVDLQTFRDRRAPSKGLALWQLAAAAVLGGCIVSLGFLGLLVSEQSAIIASLRQELGAARDSSHLHDNFEVVSTIAPQIYPVRRASGSRSSGSGVIYVCPKHEQWSLSMTNLERPPVGQQYVFWFMTENGPVRAGTLDIPAEGPAMLESASMPRGTHSFSLTLEDEGIRDLPEGEVVLRADEAIKL